MQPRYEVAFDLDDVVLDFVGGLIESMKKEYDYDIPTEAITDFDLKPYLNPVIGRSWWDWMRDRENLWPNFKAVDGAIGTIDRLRREGFYLELLTSKPEWAEHNVWKWLGKWRPRFQRVTIVGKDDVKADFSSARVLVDDKLDNVRQWADTDRYAILFTRPHNAKYRGLGPYILRANGWKDVYDMLHTLRGLEEAKNEASA